MAEDSEMRYEMSWNNDGISITLWELYDDGEAVSRDGTWYTWEEVFDELLGRGMEEYPVDIV